MCQKNSIQKVNNNNVPKNENNIFQLNFFSFFCSNINVDFTTQTKMNHHSHQHNHYDDRQQGFDQHHQQQQQQQQQAQHAPPQKWHSYKVLVDPLIHVGAPKMVRYDGLTVPGDPHHIPPNPLDPRSRLPNALWKRLEAMELPVPKFKVSISQFKEATCNPVN